jgi:hypothetical protein
MNISPRTRSSIERAAYNRAADLAKSHAECWEYEARGNALDPEQQDADWFPAAAKAEHWRIIEKELRALADKPKRERPS